MLPFKKNETDFIKTFLVFLGIKIRLQFSSSYSYCLQCFEAVGWAAGRASGL